MPIPSRKVRGSCRNVRYSAGLHSQKCRPNGSFLMISERADRSTIFDGMPVPPLGLATECPILPSEVAFGCRNAWLNQIGGTDSGVGVGLDREYSPHDLPPTVRQRVGDLHLSARQP